MNDEKIENPGTPANEANSAENAAAPGRHEQGDDRGRSASQGDRSGGRRRGGDRQGQKGGRGGGRPPAAEVQSEFVEKVLAIKRVTKVTKGGKKLSFSALVVVGDGKGRVGYALDKAGEVAIAIRKSLMTAKKNMVRIPMKGATIPHEIIGVCGGAEVLLKPASEGTGVIASGTVRAVCDGAGIHDILTKCHRSNNPINVVKATFDGLTRLKSVANGSAAETNAGAAQPATNPGQASKKSPENPENNHAGA